MKPYQVWILMVSLCLWLCSGNLSSSVAFGQSCEQWGGKIVSVQGAAQVRKAGESKWITVELNTIYCPGDTIRVLKNSRAAIALSNETLFRLDQNTTVTFTGVEKEKTFLIDIIKGVTHFFSRQPRRLKVVTPFLNAAVEGTEFYVRVAQVETFISIFEGRILASNRVGDLALTDGQSAVAEAGKAPALRIVARPRDAVLWALYYPPVLYFPPGEVPKEDRGDPHFLAYHASQLLAVGRVEEAGADIERALSLDPTFSDAFALQSIIAVVQNEKEKAVSAAQKAIDTGPNSATARIAMSYARQAGFDLESARSHAEEAVKLDGNNALAWARLAELWSSSGNLDKALDAAKKAIALEPKLARTQMVLGFAYLTQVKTTEAKDAFKKAIELDQTDPLSRLGLGLAKIRDGDLKAGGREIEIAASLDPNNSLVRSYLGKTYFEEKRTDLDGREYAIAKKLDPNDPTPWYYDAIRKQTINRPVEALQDMQKSIELNDNRSVYRSRLLLDQDLAARSASLGRIYNDLGFQQLGLVEGWKSVNTSPANYSAHRLLADLYAAMPRHEIARVSELLQSQLLQPINITPVQPQLAESNLFILDGAGPSDPSFNEFNPLFLRNRFALQGSGLLGENETLGENLIQSTVWEKLSYSIGQFHYETDGFRENNDQDWDIYNIFAQVSLSPETSLQAEYRKTDVDTGDLYLLFDPNNFFPNIRQEESSDSFRLGFRHNFAAHSDIIASAIRRSTDFGTFISPDFQIEEDEDSYMGEIQYLFRSTMLQLIGGVGHVSTDFKEKLKFSPFPPEVTDVDIDHTNIYLYSHFQPQENLSLTLGASADFLEDDSLVNRDQFNPKFGFTWNPLSLTTVRGAVFRALKRTVVASQTIEPTQVAGFNQFFDDPNATESWRYGVGIDQKFPSKIYAGAELSKRDLDVPQIKPGITRQIRNFDREERLARLYSYWTPQSWLAISAEYQYEKFKFDSEATNELGTIKVDTHRFPLGINLFSSKGIIGRIKATYIDQNGKFEDGLGAVLDDGDSFWVVDASLGYRLPKRYGLINFEIKNLFNEEFKFQDTDPANPRISPDRLILGRITLAF